MKSSDLNINEYASYYTNYVKQAGSKNILESLQESNGVLDALFSDISEERMNYKYAKDKWTIKELLLHIIDTERVFAYRALRFAREDKTDLPGFEQDDYVITSDANTRSKTSLLNEYNTQRASTISLFSSFNDSMLMKIGMAGGNPMSVRAIGFITSGHEVHHCNILQERYL